MKPWLGGWADRLVIAALIVCVVIAVIRASDTTTRDAVIPAIFLGAGYLIGRWNRR